jgi:hypothetical protein
MSKLSPERRKIVVLGGSIAVMSGGVGLLGRDHPVVMWIWLAVLLMALVYVAMQLVKLKRGVR